VKNFGVVFHAVFVRSLNRRRECASATIVGPLIAVMSDCIPKSPVPCVSHEARHLGEKAGKCSLPIDRRRNAFYAREPGMHGKKPVRGPFEAILRGVEVAEPKKIRLRRKGTKTLA